jgi:hypothetical protein
VLSFSLEGHTKNTIAKVSSIERKKGSAGLLFVQMHKTEAATPPRHDVRSQADRSHSAKLREQPIQSFHCRARGQIVHHHLGHEILLITEFNN